MGVLPTLAVIHKPAHEGQPGGLAIAGFCHGIRQVNVPSQWLERLLGSSGEGKAFRPPDNEPLPPEVPIISKLFQAHPFGGIPETF